MRLKNKKRVRASAVKSKSDIPEFRHHALGQDDRPKSENDLVSRKTAIATNP